VTVNVPFAVRTATVHAPEREPYSVSVTDGSFRLAELGTYVIVELSA
jgi:hypothetical protein